MASSPKPPPPPPPLVPRVCASSTRFSEATSDTPVTKPEVSIFDLLNAVNAVLKRFEKRDNPREIYEDKWTVSEKIEHLMRVLSERTGVRFSELFEGVTSRSEVVVTFLAVLELIRLKQLTALQHEPFGEIEICRMAPAPNPPAPATGAEPPPQPAETPSL